MSSRLKDDGGEMREDGRSIESMEIVIVVSKREIAAPRCIALCVAWIESKKTRHNA